MGLYVNNHTVILWRPIVSFSRENITAHTKTTQARLCSSTVISRMQNQWYIVSVTFGTTYLTDMVTSVPPYESYSLVKNNILHESKATKITSKIHIPEVCNLLGNVGHVTYSLINMLFIFYDKLRPHILLVGITANAALIYLQRPIIKHREETFIWFYTMSQLFDSFIFLFFSPLFWRQDGWLVQSIMFYRVNMTVLL